MPKLTAISGVGGKLPAAFLIHLQGKQILLDLGEGPEPGVLPNFHGVDSIEAVVLSHAHVDHAGALSLLPQLGNPSVYASAATWSFLQDAPVPASNRHVLPLEGAISVGGTTLTVGQAGHAPGGLWLHLDAGDGLLYMGDHSVESALLPFDRPPRAEVVIADASYGDRNDSLCDQIEAVVEASRGGAVLCVPTGGRGPEMALALHQAGLPVKLDAQIASELRYLSRPNSGLIRPEARQSLAALLQAPLAETSASPLDVIVATGPNADYGLSQALANGETSGFRFIFTGFVPNNSRARQLLDAKKAQWLPWNVHPRMKDIVALADETQAQKVVPAFLEKDKAPKLLAKLGERLCWDRIIPLTPASADCHNERTLDV
ncbi:MBL fold metallo-hydrolase [Pseudovibrio exalbescens]|uniref:MBL fold metallo-hydrolase n=1 Tax=Pseudovibrio exalbescens TaxID=197461 RepID=UPI002366ECC1|nr:MBL fold metallo-hydrolase [Pseudovibrio exalbescens]MDD7911647.1 MBL fold metallo-hydrolase [Pseudovibrio exalbescens]